jgi:hypothetical protein
MRAGTSVIARALRTATVHHDPAMRVPPPSIWITDATIAYN